MARWPWRGSIEGPGGIVRRLSGQLGFTWGQVGPQDAGPGLHLEPRPPQCERRRAGLSGEETGSVELAGLLRGGGGEDGAVLASELLSRVVVGCCQEEAAHLAKEGFVSRLKPNPCIVSTAPSAGAKFGPRSFVLALVGGKQDRSWARYPRQPLNPGASKNRSCEPNQLVGLLGLPSVPMALHTQSFLRTSSRGIGRGGTWIFCFVYIVCVWLLNVWN